MTRVLWAAAVAAAAFAVPPRTGTAGEPTRVRRVAVTTDAAPDCSSLKSIVASVTRGCKTNDEKAIALYNFMLLTHYHQQYPGEAGGVGALKEINVYGWSLCGGLHTVQAALWREMGWEWRYVGWTDPGHTTVEAKYDGRWHYLDVFLRFYAWVPDPNAPGGRTIASQDDIKADPSLVTDKLALDRGRGVYYHAGNRFELVDDRANWTAPSFLSCGDPPKGILTGVKSNTRAGSPTGWAGLQFDSPGYSTDVDLSAGGSLALGWDAAEGAHWWNGRKSTPRHGCGDKDYRNCPVIGPVFEPYEKTAGERRGYASGTLTFAPDLSTEAGLVAFAARDNVRLAAGTLVPADPSKPASVTAELRSPYVMSRASGVAAGADAVAVSVDGGKTFKPVAVADFSDAVGGKYGCLVRVTFGKALTALRLGATVQCNRGSLPFLAPGKNRVTVTVADPKELGDNRLVVTYVYHPGSRTKSYEELAALGAEVARAHHAAWSAEPVVVRRVFAAKDLPAAFDIDVPTPKGAYPVYPRMVSVTRAVVAAAGPAPAGAVEAATVGPNEELKSLPRPFGIGTVKPPAATPRPVTTRTIPLKAGGVVSADGKAAANHFLKGKAGETWVLLVGGDLAGLPAAKDVAVARLVFPVVRGHDRAATKVAATLLTAPFEPGRPFDFKGLGEPDGVTAVPKQPAAGDYTPPLPVAVDVTRSVKRVAAGDATFRGFGLRVVPDRVVDDGYITRLDLPADPAVRLEVDVYDRK